MSRKAGLIKVVVGILKHNNKILVTQRPEGKPYSGYWEFPGGKIEVHESGADALARELHEELGVDVKAAQLYFKHAHAYPDKTVHLEIWLVEQFSGEPHGKENQALRWVDLEEIFSLRLLEGNWAILEKLKTLF